MNEAAKISAAKSSAGATFLNEVFMTVFIIYKNTPLQIQSAYFPVARGGEMRFSGEFQDAGPK
jgi:hypothetical protein